MSELSRLLGCGAACGRKEAFLLSVLELLQVLLLLSSLILCYSPSGKFLSSPCKIYVGKVAKIKNHAQVEALLMHEYESLVSVL